MAEIFVDALYDAVLDCLKVIPILFLAYLLVSYLSHDHSHKFSKFLSKNKKTSVLYASCLGCVPQCGFSSVIADLYSHGTVSIGTLVAVFVATSDEAIPLMLTNSNSILPMLLLVAIKVVLAIFWGYMIDLVVGYLRKRQHTKTEIHAKHHEHHEHGENEIDDEHECSHHIHECGHIHTEHCSESCGHEHGCCANNIFLDAFMHTFNIVLYIFVATFIINIIVGYCGTSALESLLSTNMYLQVLLASLIGLIPNCASSVLLVELYMLYGTLSFPALVAGLTAGAGVGMVILWSKNRKRPLENLGILILQYVIGVASGMLLTLFF
ncbi:MAG: putative manganese transporter [Candidatus Caccovivens sp.]